MDLLLDYYDLSRSQHIFDWGIYNSSLGKLTTMVKTLKEIALEGICQAYGPKFKAFPWSEYPDWMRHAIFDIAFAYRPRVKNNRNF